MCIIQWKLLNWDASGVGILSRLSVSRLSGFHCIYIIAKTGNTPYRCNTKQSFKVHNSGELNFNNSMGSVSIFALLDTRTKLLNKNLFKSELLNIENIYIYILGYFTFTLVFNFG